jgi:hypothetical protein
MDMGSPELLKPRRGHLLRLELRIGRDPIQGWTGFGPERCPADPSLARCAANTSVGPDFDCADLEASSIKPAP